MKIKQIGIVIAVLLIVAIVTVGCGDTEKNKEPIHPTNSTETEAGKDKDDKVPDTQDGTETVEEVVFDETTATSAWTNANLNLRKTPDTTGEVITIISEGTEIKKSLEDNGWVLVKSGDKIGYVSAKYLSDTKPEDKPVTPIPDTPRGEAIPGQHRDPNRIVVVIDPGHQRKGNSTKEANGPGSSTMKARVTQGATGVATGVPEYVMNLEVSLLLKTELENRGYTVYMTRSTHDVDISNMERAQYATSVNADIAVRIHGNGSSNSSVSGAECYAPSASNPYVSHLSNASMDLSRKILNAYCAATGFRNRGVFASDTMTGINWSSVPVTIVEMGYMSNPDDDRNMQDGTMRNNMIQGIANGIDAYFGL